MFSFIIRILEGATLSTFLFTAAYSLYCVSAGAHIALTSGLFYWIIRQIRETSEICALPYRATAAG